MIRGLGRVLLVGVGAFMLAMGIVFLTEVSFDLDHLSSILLQIVSIIAGLSAAFAGLRGEGGFWFTIFSLLMIGLVIYYGVVNAKNFSDGGWHYVGQFIVSLITQILYALGFIFLKIGKKK